LSRARTLRPGHRALHAHDRVETAVGAGALQPRHRTDHGPPSRRGRRGVPGIASSRSVVRERSQQSRERAARARKERRRDPGIPRGGQAAAAIGGGAQDPRCRVRHGRSVSAGDRHHRPRAAAGAVRSDRSRAQAPAGDVPAAQGRPAAAVASVPDFVMTKRYVRLALVLAGAIVLYTVDLGRAPIYLHEAEVLFALHAQSIATTLHDTNGRLLPLYFQMPQSGASVWFHPMIVYAMVPFLAVLPLSEFAIRLPSVFVGLVDITLVYFIAARLFRSERWALLAAALLVLTPSHFIHSRVAMDYLYPVPFVLGWLLGLQLFLARRDRRLLFVATSCLGVGFYSYIASVGMMPLYLLMTLAVVWLEGDTSFRSSAVAIAGFTWPLVLLIWIVFHPAFVAQTAARYQVGQSAPPGHAAGAPLSVVLEDLRNVARFSPVTGRISLYWYFFDPSYLFVTGGYANAVNSVGPVGVFPAPFAVLLPVGLVALLAVPGAIVDRLVVAGFATAPLVACLVVPEPYAIDRELALLPFWVLAAVAGARFLQG